MGCLAHSCALLPMLCCPAAHTPPWDCRRARPGPASESPRVCVPLPGTGAGRTPRHAAGFGRPTLRAPLQGGPGALPPTRRRRRHRCRQPKPLAQPSPAPAAMEYEINLENLIKMKRVFEVRWLLLHRPNKDFTSRPLPRRRRALGPAPSLPLRHLPTAPSIHPALPQEADEDGSGELDPDEFYEKLGPYLGQSLSQAEVGPSLVVVPRLLPQLGICCQGMHAGRAAAEGSSPAAAVPGAPARCQPIRAPFRRRWRSCSCASTPTAAAPSTGRCAGARPAAAVPWGAGQAKQ